GKMRALAVTSLQRSKAFPDLPTVSEAALEGYEASSWWGVLAPGRTPPEIINKLHTDIAGVLQLPEPRGRITSLVANRLAIARSSFPRCSSKKWASGQTSSRKQTSRSTRAC